MLANALMKKGLKLRSGCISVDGKVLANALMKKGLKQMSSLTFARVACSRMP